MENTDIYLTNVFIILTENEHKTLKIYCGIPGYIIISYKK